MSRSRSVLECVVAITMLALCAAAPAETSRGLTVAPEHRCTAYDRKRDYRYPQSLEADIVRALGGVYGPYTGTCFASTLETEIEHLVATSEAHDSGLCAADAATRRAFARHLRNMTLASPTVNRHRKPDNDVGEWLPARNACWFAGRVVEVKRAYGLTGVRRRHWRLCCRGGRAWRLSSAGVPHHHRSEEGDFTDHGGGRRQRTVALRRQPQRAHHLQGGAHARHRAVAREPPGIHVHERPGRGQRGLGVRLMIASAWAAKALPDREM